MCIRDRRYAKRQTSWIRNQLLPEIRKAQERGEDVWLYLLDATDPAFWRERVSDPAHRILEAFIAHDPMPDPRAQSAAAAEQLAVPEQTGSRLERNRLVACDTCTSDEAQPFLYRENERDKHMQSRTHRMALKRRSRAAYIAEGRARARS